MILHPIEIEYFKPSNRILKNPYMGFMTFNHFRGGKLFSNSVQGIYKERYPISEDVLQEGEKEAGTQSVKFAILELVGVILSRKKGNITLNFTKIFLTKQKNTNSTLL